MKACGKLRYTGKTQVGTEVAAQRSGVILYPDLEPRRHVAITGSQGGRHVSPGLFPGRVAKNPNVRADGAPAQCSVEAIAPSQGLVELHDLG